MHNSDWYNNLNKPFLSPPNWIFAPVWTILYILMFSSLVLFIVKPGYNKGLGYAYFLAQLFLNFLWSPVFFGLQNIKLALLIVILLDVFVFLTIKSFYSVSKTSGILLAPYFLWVLFATYLNFSYVILN